MISIVLKIRKEGRKKFPEAVAAFIDRNKAEKYVKELLEKGENKEGVWIEPSFTYEMKEHEVWGYDKTIIDEKKLSEVVYPIWFIESRRDVCGMIKCTMKSEKDAELFGEYEWPICKNPGLKGYMVLKCQLFK